ncbi:MAG: leucyl/phenylalanyl-tRNA--protein transferase [Bacteroidales bacterium]|nr:leucyl/phenylalanyl-tRNA--protein transferase [Bacteroidales bacterium]
MPVEISHRKLEFPDLEEADESGLLAVGGDLSLERLKLAYSKGIFPWYEKGMPILWWSPDPRMVLFPDKMIISHSLKQIIKKQHFTVTIDTAFEKVIKNCAQTPRKGENGTWITREMKNAYIDLHKAGFAHSAEAWLDGKLVGGLYGVAIGKAYFGESMFHHVTNASKVAFFHLVEKLSSWDFKIIDAQVYTNHLESLGGEMIPRSQYIQILEKALLIEDAPGSWERRN